VKLLLGLLLLVSSVGWAFPENVRQGYFSCSSCHVSSTGGGLLTEYGRRTQEEFMATWAKEKQADFMFGAFKLPSSLSLGGDVRFLSVKTDNQVTTTQAGFPMQADLEVGWNPIDSFTLVATFGAYSAKSDMRRYYAKYQFDENWMLRIGQFYPAFGIQHPDHSLFTRRLLGFDERQENRNAELGYVSEKFEVIFDAIIGGTDEGQQFRETGYSLRAQTFVGERSAIGLSHLHGKSNVWERDAFGPFIMIGFSPKSYLLSEVYYQKKKAVESDDASTPDHAGIITTSKVGYDLFRGFQLFASYESADSSQGDYVAKQRSYGPGLQWIPIPHLEFYGKLEKRLDENFSKDYGYQSLFVTHYWF